MPDNDRMVMYGTGKEGAALQLTALHEVLMEMTYQRSLRDAEKATIKDLVALETADWPEGAYTISSDPSEPTIKYNGVSIFEYMKTVRK